MTVNSKAVEHVLEQRVKDSKPKLVMEGRVGVVGR